MSVVNSLSLHRKLSLRRLDFKTKPNLHSKIRTNNKQKADIKALSGIDTDYNHEHTLKRSLCVSELARTVISYYVEPTAIVRENWGKKYTQVSISIFGKPNASIAKNLLANLLYEVVNHQPQSKISHYYAFQLNKFINNLNIKQLEPVQAKKINEYSQASEVTKAYLYANYAKEFAIFNKASNKIQPKELQKIFSKCLKSITKKDKNWASWKVNIQKNSAVISVEPKDYLINIGENRRPLTRLEAKGIFAHEFLAHVQRSVNGKLLDNQLSLGLPEYLNAEEGLGVWFEYAITGIIPQKITDRYLDIALALGEIGNRQITKKELVRFCTLREQFRESLDSDYINQKHITAKVNAHVNRIYRGTKGNDFTGVFSKDVVYLKGFIRVANFMKAQLSRQISINNTLDFVLSGKFDPTNLKHVAFVTALKE